MTFEKEHRIAMTMAEFILKKYRKQLRNVHAARYTLYNGEM